MLTTSSLASSVKNAVSSFLPMSWYAMHAPLQDDPNETLVRDVEKGQDVLNNEQVVFQIQQVQGRLYKGPGSSMLQFTYGYHGEIKTIHVANQSLLDDALSELTEINQWVISVANGETLYKYRDNYDEIKTLSNQNELDICAARSIPSSNNAWVINDVTQSNSRKTYVMKNYNCFWSVIDTKRYSESNLQGFLNDLFLAEKSWGKTKLLLKTGIAVVTTAAGAYAAYYHVMSKNNTFKSQLVSADLVSGNEFHVNTYTTATQEKASIATLSNGGFVVVWTSGVSTGAGQDGDGYGVYGQLYDLNGTAQASEFRVNTYTVEHQWEPSVAALTTSGFVVSWTSGSGTTGQDGSGYGVYAQRYDNNAQPLGVEFRVNTYTTSLQQVPRVAGLSDGGFVITWRSSGQDGDAYGVYAKAYDASGIPQSSEFQVNTFTTGFQFEPAISGLPNGGFVVVWTSGDSSGAGQDGSDYGVYAKIYNGTYTPQGNEFLVNTFTANSQYTPDVSTLTSGDFIVVWQSRGQEEVSASNIGIYGQKFDQAGVKLGNEFIVNSYTTGSQTAAAVASLKNGGFVVTWGSWSQDGVGSGVFSQRYNNATVPVAVGNEFQVNTYTSSNEEYPSVAPLNEGNFVIVWSGGRPSAEIEVYGKMFNVIPGLSSNSAIISYVENDPPLIVDPNIIINDADDGVFGASAAITTNFKPGQDSLAFVDQNGITGFYNATSGALQFSGSASRIEYQTVLRNVTFFTGVDPGGFQRIVSFKIMGSSFESNPLTQQINVTPVNDPPIILNNQLTINEGQTKIITSSDVSATDVDNVDTTLIFTVSAAMQGNFELVSAPGVVITSFTQQLINSNQIQFVHDGGEISPSYQLSVSDGTLSTLPASAAITFSNLNDAPTIENNRLTLDEGIMKIISSWALSATDVDNNPTTLVFNVRNVTHGQFELVSDLGVMITSFIQQQITNSTVQFVHDGGALAPSYEVSVSDGNLNTTFSSADINFYTPVLSNNTLAINEGETKILTDLILSATDNDSSGSLLTFSVSNIQQGQFEFVTTPGIVISNFTQQHINNNQVQFAHDGGEISPSYEVSVSDGVFASAPTLANIIFTHTNDAPVLLDNKLAITSGQTRTLTAENLNAADVDNNPESLAFIPSNTQNGQFELGGNPGIASNNFTLAQINNNEVHFVHDGSNNPPSYQVSVSDGMLSTAPVAATINFHPPAIVGQIPDQELLSEQPLLLDIRQYFNDEDSLSVSYSATQENGDALPIWLSFDSTLGLFSGSTNHRNNLHLAVRANDGDFDSAQNIFTLKTAAPDWVKLRKIGVASILVTSGLAIGTFFGIKNQRNRQEKIRHREEGKQRDILHQNLLNAIDGEDEKSVQAMIGNHEGLVNTALTRDDDTALHHAIKRNKINIVHILLSSGADTSIKNAQRQSPSQLAEGLGLHGIVQALQKKQTPTPQLLPTKQQQSAVEPTSWEELFAKLTKDVTINQQQKNIILTFDPIEDLSEQRLQRFAELITASSAQSDFIITHASALGLTLTLSLSTNIQAKRFAKLLTEMSSRKIEDRAIPIKSSPTTEVATTTSQVIYPSRLVEKPLTPVITKRQQHSTRSLLNRLIDVDGHRGEIAYVGPLLIDEPSVKWIGVKFYDPIGKHNGTLNGKEYFKTYEDHGGFVNVNHPNLHVFPDDDLSDAWLDVHNKHYEVSEPTPATESWLVKAKESHEAALKIAKSTYGIEHAETARLLKLLGNIYGDLENFTQALASLKQALTAELTIYGEKHYEIVKTYASIGFIYYQQHDFQRALQCFDKALAITTVYSITDEQGEYVTKIVNHRNDCQKMVRYIADQTSPVIDEILALSSTPVQVKAPPEHNQVIPESTTALPSTPWEQLFAELRVNFDFFWTTPLELRQDKQKIFLEFLPDDGYDEDNFEDFAEELRVKSAALEKNDFSIKNCDVDKSNIVLILETSIQAKRFVRLIKEKSNMNFVNSQSTHKLVEIPPVELLSTSTPSSSL